MFFGVLNKSNNYIRYGLIAAIIVYCGICYGFWALDKNALWEVATEDHLLENMATIFLLICALLSFVLFGLSIYGVNSVKARHKNNLWFLFLGIVFLFGVGEEVNWGQRYFNLSVPEKLEQINVQKELNIHNIIYFNPRDFNNIKKPFWQQVFTFNVAYVLFILGFGFLIPLVHRFSAVCARWINRIRLPLVPLEIGIIFVFSYLISKVIQFFLVDESLRYPNEEIRENIWAFLLLVVAIRWLMNQVQLVIAGKEVEV